MSKKDIRNQDVPKPSFTEEYLRSILRYARIPLALMTIYLAFVLVVKPVVLPAVGAVAGAAVGAVGAVLSPLTQLLMAGTPEDPNWQVPIDLPGAGGGCADPNATAYTTPLTGQTVYQTREGC